MPRRVLAASPERPGHVEGRVPLDEAHDLGPGGLRGNRPEQVHVIRPQGALFKATCCLCGQRAPDVSQRAPPFVVERFSTLLRDTDDMILAVPLGMTESLAVWHARLPLGETLSGSREGVGRFDSRNCQTLGVPRQSRGFTVIKSMSQKISDNCLNFSVHTVDNKATTREVWHTEGLAWRCRNAQQLNESKT
jgi:hypothetical protein